MKTFKKMVNNTFALRRAGCAAIDLSYVAAGITDAHSEIGLNPWDIAAGSVIVSEAGGKVSIPENDLLPSVSFQRGIA